MHIYLKKINSEIGLRFFSKVPKIWGVSPEPTQNYKYLHNFNKILKLRVYLNETIWNNTIINQELHLDRTKTR